MGELLSGYANIGNSIDNLWNIFMGLHLVLFASILKYGKAMSRAEKLTFLLAYLTFFIMNSRAIINNYGLLEAVRISFTSAINEEATAKYNDLLKAMRHGGLAYRTETTIFIHLFGLAIVSYLLFSRKK